MQIRRIAVIFDDRDRPETTGIYCLRALRGLVDVEHFRADELDRIPRDGFDFYLNIDDGLNYRIPEILRPRVWWAIDTHLNFAWCLEKARGFDLIFAAQRNGAERLKAEGIESACWLPLAYDPEAHPRFEVEKQHDVAFVGNLFPGPRMDLVTLLKRRFGRVFVGRAYFEEMARIYSEARIVFNRSLLDDVNMRVFEAVGCGSLLLTNDLSENGQAELFRDGVHLATYADEGELVDKVRYYVQRDALREQIASTGRREALAKHTYRHRMEALLAKAELLLSATHVRPAAMSSRGATFHTPEFEPQTKVLGDDGLQANVAWDQSSGKADAGDVDATPDDWYFDFDRPEILALIPATARRVLDVGCGAGRLGEALKARQSAEVVGIEASEVAAKRARTRLDRVLVGDVEKLNLDFAPGTFDCLICGDVLEHLSDPAAFLSRAMDWLTPGATVVASLPNVRHFSVVSALLAGNWTYERAGLLDETHLRFFTRRDMLDLFERSGYRVQTMRMVTGPEHEEWQRQGKHGEVRIGRLHVAGMAPDEAEEFFVIQYLLTATVEAQVEDDRKRSQQNPNDVGLLRLVGLQDRQMTSESAGPAGVVAVIARQSTPTRASTSRSESVSLATAVGTDRVRTARSRLRRMRFRQDFVTDFEQFDFSGRPFAFSRYGDGERSICRGVPVTCHDGWAFDGRPTRFSADLNAALTFADSDYYVGISDGCCDPEARDWFLERICVPLEQVTFANIFVNGNYGRFRMLDLSNMTLVASVGGEFTVPENLVNSNFDIDGLVDELREVDRPILVAAGPASAIIIHKYWQRPGPKQAIVDVGSAIDEPTKGYKTRRYQYPGSPTADRICQW